MTERATAQPRPNRWRPARQVVAGLVVLGSLVLLLWLLVLEPERHPDGVGSLASLDRDGRIGMSADRATTVPVTFGLRLCIRDSSERAIIESIVPTAEVGSRVTYLGGRVRHLDFTATTGAPTTIASVEGFPPSSVAQDTMAEAVGAIVTDRCEHENPTAYTELLLGFQGAPGVSGGWHGVDVGYRAGWRHRVVSIGYDLLVCGAVGEDCAAELVP